MHMPTLPTRALGKTGLDVCVLGIGCAWLGRQPDNSINFETGVAAVIAALEAGIRLIDTASLYSFGEAERMVGEALRQRPDLARDTLVETKIRDVRDFTYTADEARRSVETSLQRLGIDRIPMIYIHDPPADIVGRVVGPDGALAGLRRREPYRPVDTTLAAAVLRLQIHSHSTSKEIRAAPKRAAA